MAMRLHIIARGKIGRSPESELVDRYLKRISWPTRHSELPDRGGELPASDSPHKTIIMDEKGEQMSSVELARLLERWRDDGVREVRFLIGAADGFDDTARGCRQTDCLWQSDMAAFNGARDARRTIVPRHLHHCQPPLSS